MDRLLTCSYFLIILPGVPGVYFMYCVMICLQVFVKRYQYLFNEKSIMFMTFVDSKYSINDEIPSNNKKLNQIAPTLTACNVLVAILIKCC